MSDVAAAAAALRRGDLVVLPTDTVYGVGADPANPAAVNRLFAAKGRPEDKAIPVLVAGLDQARSVAVIEGRAENLAREHWPGPLTLVLARASGFDADLGGTDDATVAVRVPEHPMALELLRAAGPLAVTSANRSGEPAAATVAEARAQLGEAVAVYLDGGPSRGVASTVAKVTPEGIEILREGSLDLGGTDGAIRKT